MPPKKLTLPEEAIANMIREIRGVRVILDIDLAALYGVETKALNRAVKRNPDRFPEDFMFQLTRQEFEVLRYQFGTLKTGEDCCFEPCDHGSQRLSICPFAFPSTVRSWQPTF